MDLATYSKGNIGRHYMVADGFVNGPVVNRNGAMHMYTDRQTHAHTHTHTQTQTHAHTHTHTHTHTGPVVMRNGAMSTELSLRYGDGRIRIQVLYAPVCLTSET